MKSLLLTLSAILTIGFQARADEKEKLCVQQSASHFCVCQVHFANGNNVWAKLYRVDIQNAVKIESVIGEFRKDECELAQNSFAACK